ncbi:MAG: LCP family protein [Blautia sp.]|nr:LCP family protein [Blautia sp.]
MDEEKDSRQNTQEGEASPDNPDTDPAIEKQASDQSVMTEHHHEHHHEHSHKKRKRHHHSRRYRLKRWLRTNKTRLIVAIAAVFAALAAALVFVYLRQAEQSLQHVSAGNSYDMGGGYRQIEYEGQRYSYNSLITTVLYTGIDSAGEMQNFEQLGFAPRADSIALAVLDKKHKKMSIISINRDTMTEIRRLSIFGESVDYYVSNLEFAYAYGDGAELSCEMLVEAVSKLLQIPVNEYLVTNRESMKYINDIVGGVQVTVPNDDLAEEYPEMHKGNVVEITDDNVETYLRHRDTAVDFSNAGRIDRQRSYIAAYLQKIQQLLPDGANDIWRAFERMAPYIQTSITKNKYIQYMNLLNTVGYSDTDFIKLEGEYKTSDLYDQFYVDEDALRRLVIDLFYEPM